MGTKTRPNEALSSPGDTPRVVSWPWAGFIGDKRMERWEAIYKLFFLGDYALYQCTKCKRKFKTEGGVYRHIENNHNAEINKLRDQSIVV